MSQFYTYLGQYFSVPARNRNRHFLVLEPGPVPCLIAWFYTAEATASKKKPCRFKEEKELVMEDRRVKLSFQHVRTSLELVVSCSSTSILLVAAAVRDQLLMQLSSVELCKVIHYCGNIGFQPSLNRALQDVSQKPSI